MGICSAKTPQTEQGKPAVTTRGSISGPKGPHKMAEIVSVFCLFLTDSIIISLCNTLAALRAARGPAVASRPAAAPIDQVGAALPASTNLP